MEKFIVAAAISVIAGIVLFIVILINNTDKETRKPSNEWWIPSTGFFLTLSVLLPIYLFIDEVVYPTQSLVIEWLMFVILGISVITWTVGKIIRRKNGKM